MSNVHHIAVGRLTYIRINLRFSLTKAFASNVPTATPSGNYTRGPHSVLKGFKEFILKGNVVELATAVIVGAAFTAIVTAFTEKVVQPLINAIPGSSNPAQGLGFQINDNANTFVDLGALIAAAIDFILVAAVVYFIIILPYNKLSELGGFAKKTEDSEVDLLTEIRNILDPEAAAKAKAKAEAEAPVAAAPLTTAFDARGRGPAPQQQFNPGPPSGALPTYPPRGDGPAITPSRDFGGPPSGAIPVQTQRIQPQGPSGPPPAAPAGGGYAPPNPAPGPGQGAYPPPPQNYPPQGQGNQPPQNYPPSGGFPAQDPDAGRHSR